MTHVATNPHEESARLRKAYRLADECNELPIAMLQDAGDDFWKTCAEQAGCNKPSEKCVELVISILRQRDARGSRTPNDDLRPPTSTAQTPSNAPAEGRPATPLSEFPCPNCLDRGVDEKGNPCLQCENRAFGGGVYSADEIFADLEGQYRSEGHR